MSRAEATVARPTGVRPLALGTTLAVLVLALALPPLFDGLSRAGQRALLVTLIVIVLWTTEALEPGVTALLAIVLLALTGAADGIRPALQGFANPVPYFLVGVLTMGVAVVRSGLAERLARAILDARARPQPGRVPAPGPRVPGADLRAAVGHHALGHPHPHLRRGVRAGRRAARRAGRQGSDARAVLDQPAGVHRAVDRRHHAGDERGDHRRHVVDRMVHADGGAVLHDHAAGRRADLGALSGAAWGGAAGADADARARR